LGKAGRLSLSPEIFPKLDQVWPLGYLALCSRLLDLSGTKQKSPHRCGDLLSAAFAGDYFAT
jgi:hypothetical protein